LVRGPRSRQKAGATRTRFVGTELYQGGGGQAHVGWPERFSGNFKENPKSWAVLGGRKMRFRVFFASK